MPGAYPLAACCLVLLAVARQAMIEQKGMLLILPTQAASMAAYSRDMARSADEGGQILTAASGYDPR